MTKVNLKTALSLLIIPVLSWGCTKTKPDEKKAPEKVQEKKVLTSNKVTKFEGLSEKIKREKIPDQAIICTVGSDAINVGDYKLHFRFKQEQAKQLLQKSPVPPPNLLKDAKRQGIVLTEREKSEFLLAAYKQGGTALQAKIDSGEVKRKPFEKSVLDMGLILKAVNAGIEKQLLTELINNSLLLNAARKNGLGKIAFNRYVEVKHSDLYKEYLRTTKLTPNQLKDQILEEILVNLMKERIIDKAEVRDKYVFQYYKDNKKHFQHGGRVKWSQILVADPERDFQALLSVGSIVNRKYPKLTIKQKLAKIKELKEEKKNKAIDIVKRAQSGADFAKLANENTDDIPARASKTGGDMGYADLDQLASNQMFSTIANSLKTMVEGEVYPKPIKSIVGWHIIKLTEKQEPGTLPFEEVKDAVKKVLVQQNSALAVQSWIIQQREVIPVKISKRFKSFISQANNLNLEEEKTAPQKKNKEASSENKEAETTPKEQNKKDQKDALTKDSVKQSSKSKDKESKNKSDKK